MALKGYSLNVEQAEDGSFSTVTCATAAGVGDIALGTADGIVQVNRLPAGSSFTRLLSGRDPTTRLFRAQAHNKIAVKSLHAAMGPRGGGVLCSLGNDGSVVALPLIDPPERLTVWDPTSGGNTQAFQPTLSISAVILSRFMVAGATMSSVWVWDSSSPNKSPASLSDIAPVVLAWIKGSTDPILVCADSQGQLSSLRFRDGQVELIHRTQSFGKVTTLVAFEVSGGWALAGAIRNDDHDEIVSWKVDEATGEVVELRRLAVMEGRVSRLVATRGLLGAVLDGGSLKLWPLTGTGQAEHQLGEPVKEVALTRSLSGHAIAAWVNDDGGLEWATINLETDPFRKAGLCLLNDQPTGWDPARPDFLQFESFSRPLSLLVANESTATPLVMAIDGSWGTGKTSLARMLEQELPKIGSADEDELETASIWFNAWMHDDSRDIRTSMASAISDQIQKLRPWWVRLVSPAPPGAVAASKRRLRLLTAFAAIFAGLLLSFRPAWLESILTELQLDTPGGGLLSLGGLSIIGGSLRLAGLVRARFASALDAFLRSSERLADQGHIESVRLELGRRVRDATRPIPDPASRSRIPGFRRLQRWALNSLTVRAPSGSGWRARLKRGRITARSLLGAQVARFLGVRRERRLVLFVDDLDRCKAQRAVEACEAISQLLDHSHLVTIAMVDLDTLSIAAEVVYEKVADRVNAMGATGSWGRRFLDKIFQFEFTIPTYSPGTLGAMISYSITGEVASTDTYGVEDTTQPNNEQHGNSQSQGIFADLEPLPNPGDASGGALGDKQGLGRFQTALAHLGDAALPSWGSATDYSSPLYASFSKPGAAAGGSGLDITNFLPLVAIGVFLAVQDWDGSWWLKVLVVTGIVGGLGWVGVRRDLKRMREDTDLKYSSIWDDDLTDSFRYKQQQTANADQGTRLSELTDDPNQTPGPVRRTESAIRVDKREELRAVVKDGDHLDLARQEAARWVGSTTPRKAIRVANRLLFTVAVAAERGLLWTESPVDGRIIGKWVTAVELWPNLGAAVRRQPNVLKQLENAALNSGKEAFQAEVGAFVSDTDDAERLQLLLKEPPLLGRHSGALARLSGEH